MSNNDEYTVGVMTRPNCMHPMTLKKEQVDHLIRCLDSGADTDQFIKIGNEFHIRKSEIIAVRIARVEMIAKPDKKIVNPTLN
jgi:hypothetical protein